MHQKVIATIEARMGSSRLPNKVLLEANGKPMLQHMVDRVQESRLVDEIVIDSAFSPIHLVNYFVENTRVGQDTDFDRLILEVTTDGRVSPQEALTFATQIGILHFKIFDELKFQDISFDK